MWNIGEPPVQGFTNLGWTLYMGFLHLFPFPASKISLALMLTSTVILLANIVTVHGIASALAPESDYAPLLAAIVTAFYFPLVFWSLRGMEVGLLTLLINLALWLAFSKKHPAWAGAALGLAVLVRVDAALAAAVVLAYLFFKDGRRATLPLLMVGLTLAAIFYFQQSYFGDFLPATYYHKMTGYSLVERARHGLLIFLQFASRDVLAPVLFAAAGIFFYKQFTPETFLLAAVFLVQCAYSIYVGGDYAEPETNAANRFITQGMPALLILFAGVASRVLSELRNRSALRINPAISLSIIILIIISGEPWMMTIADSPPLLKADIRRVKLGLHIAQNTDPQAVIAVHAAGQIPYYAERKTIDLLGLNDLTVAKGEGRGAFYPGHNKWNYEYSIGELRPDVIADNFTALSAYMRTQDDYQFLESDIYVRKDSLLVNVKGLSSKEYR